MYSKIYEFCKVKNLGNCFNNGESPTPRVNFITSLCDSMGLEYEVDSFGLQNSGRDSYSIRDFHSIIPGLNPEKREIAEKIYSEFNKKARSIRISDYDIYDELEEEYIQKLENIMGKPTKKANLFFNIMLTGSSDKFVVAHHDIVNKDSDNANDNSCSVINALMIKKLRPEVNVIILDGEELGGIGSNRLSERITSGEFKCKWILNLELTGRGGKSFFVGAMGTPLTEWISNKFECPIVNVPFNDSVIFKKFGINSTVINPLPVTDKQGPVVNKEGQFLDFQMLFNCHKIKDSVDTIDPNDMKEFVEEVCLKIIDEA